MATKDKIKIAASAMCFNWLDVRSQLVVLEKENIDAIHWDIIDGNFAPDFSMGSSIINSIRTSTELNSEFHLMVLEPSRLLKAFRFNPGDTIIIHQESSRNLHRDLIAIRRMGCKVGVAISPATPLETLEYVIEDTDVVLVMTVNPGYQGQNLVPQTIRKIDRLRKMIDDLQIPTQIEVDGNVAPPFASEMVSAGADILVGGSSGLFCKGRKLETNIEILREEINKGLTHRMDC